MKTWPLLDGLRDDLLWLSKLALPSSELGTGVSFTLNLWQRLVCFLDHAELELSKNRAENSMRRVAPSRKNWIDAGSTTAALKLAAMLSVVETCMRTGIPERGYLMAVRRGVGDSKLREVAEATPGA